MLPTYPMRQRRYPVGAQTPLGTTWACEVPLSASAIIEMVGTHGQTANRDEPTCGYRLGAGSLPGDVYQWRPRRLQLSLVPACSAGAGGSFMCRRRSVHEHGRAGGLATS